MKKFLLMVVATIMATGIAKAQNEDLKHEIGISYGVGLSTISDGIGHGVGSGIWDGITGHKWDNDRRFGTLAAEYFYHLDNPKVAVGGIATFAQYGEDVLKKSNDEKIGKRTRNYISLMPSMKYYWLNKNYYGLYTKLAAGAMLLLDNQKDYTDNEKSNSSKAYFAFQVSAIGFEFGAKFRGFIEVGVGEQGIVLGGLKMKF
jgi:hypothetical protein